MQIEDIILSVSRTPDDGFVAFLEIAANLLGENKPLPLLNIPPHLARGGAIQALETAARLLLSEKPSERFKVICNFLDRLDHRRDGYFWIREGSAQQLVDLIGHVSSARFAFDFSIRPCLTFAIQEAQQGRQPRIEFYSSVEGICDLASFIAVIVEVDGLIEIVNGYPWEETGPRNFDVEVSMPPFGAHLPDNRNLPQDILAVLGVEHGRRGRLSFESLTIADALFRANGRVIMSVSDGELFRMVGVEPISRRNLIESNRLATVMAVPPGLMFPGTMIKTNLITFQPVTVVTEVVRFVDLGSDELVSRGSRFRLEVRDGVKWADLLEKTTAEEQGIIRDVGHDEIIDNSYVLTPERYLNTGPRDKIDGLLKRSDEALLSEVADLIRPISLIATEDGEYTLFEAAPGDITARGYVGKPGRELTVDRATYNKASNQQLQPGDLVMAIKGAIGAVGLVPDQVPTGAEVAIWTAGQSMMIIRPKKRHGISPLVLYEFLSNSTVQKFIHSIAGGTAIPTLAMKDLKEFRVPLPDESVIAEVEDTFAHRHAIFEQIGELDRQLDELRRQNWPHKHMEDAVS